MSSLLSAELSATCNALGTLDKKTGKYLIDEYTLNTVKDLVRYLRRDGEDHEIRRHLGETKVLQTDLVPLLIDHWEKNELFDVTLRLLVNLTNPALLLYQEQIPAERTARHNYLQILSHLQSYKEAAFTKVEVWNALSKKIAKVLEIDWSERDEDNGLIVERILILIRNILHVPADANHEKKPESDASVHDQVLWALNQSGFLDIILYMSSENERQYFMHIIEIISLMLREQNPSSLADAALQRSVDEKLKDEQELLALRMNEIKTKNMKMRNFMSTRHSRFGGTYVVQNMKSISENELICLKPLSDLSHLEFGNKKEKLKRPKNRRPVEYEQVERRSAFAIRLFLKEFCIEFLNGSYNPLMRHVKDVLVRAKAQQNDESYYLWAIKFFMEFNRGHNFNVALVSETMAIPIFHYVQQQVEKYHDMIRIEKKKFHVWVKRLHLGLRAYKELLNTLSAMDRSKDDAVKESAKVLKSNIFYVLEYREFVIHILFGYDENKMPRLYLVDLIETVHLFTKMLEQFCKKTGLVVQKKVKKRKSKKTQKQKSTHNTKPTQQSVEHRADEWDGEVGSQISAVIKTLPSDAMPKMPPFDAASSVPIDEQKESCVKSIQKCMVQNDYEEAVALFRAARDVWLEDGIFGTTDVTQDEELDMLHSIFLADLGVDLSDRNGADENHAHSDLSDESDDEEDEEGGGSCAVAETEFRFSDFSERFCKESVTSACGYLLRDFDKNIPHTNHCCLKMLHRIAWDHKSPGLLFQASLFRTFQRIFESENPAHKELKKFATFIMRNFTETAQQNPKIFVELLFWKSVGDSYEIEFGSIEGKGKLIKNAWTEEQEEELRRLYMENQKNPSTEQDVIDWIIDNLIDATRSRRGVVKKLKELGLIFKAPTKRGNALASRERQKERLQFGEHEDEMLKDLWEQFQSSKNPLGAVMARMPVKRPKQRVIERLLELGIIQDEQECQKKSSDKSTSKSAGDHDDHIASDSDRSSDSSRSNSPAPTPKRKSSHNAPSKKAPKALAYSSEAAAKLLLEAVEKGYKSALEWIIESVEEVALDQEAEGFDSTADGVPIVPISSESVEAMQSDLFQQLLKSLGLHAPDHEQEQYWRIPSSIYFEELRDRCKLIQNAIEGTLSVAMANISTTKYATTETNRADSSDEDDLFDKLRRLRDASPDHEGPEADINDEAVSKTGGSEKHRRNLANEDESHNVSRHTSISSSSRSALSSNQSTPYSDKNSNGSSKKTKKARRRVLSSSDNNSDSDRESNANKNLSIVTEEPEDLSNSPKSKQVAEKNDRNSNGNSSDDERNMSRRSPLSGQSIRSSDSEMRSTGKTLDRSKTFSNDGSSRESSTFKRTTKRKKRSSSSRKLGSSDNNSDSDESIKIKRNLSTVTEESLSNSPRSTQADSSQPRSTMKSNSSDDSHSSSDNSRHSTKNTEEKTNKRTSNTKTSNHSSDSETESIANDSNLSKATGRDKITQSSEIIQLKDNNISKKRQKRKAITSDDDEDSIFAKRTLDTIAEDSDIENHYSGGRLVSDNEEEIVSRKKTKRIKVFEDDSE